MNKADNKVTVLIPTFNRAERLAVAMSSVLSQTYQNLVLIVSDNASTDNTEAIMAELSSKDNRVRYVRKESNVGFIENMNSLVKLVDTPFFCILADDDYYHEAFIENALEMLSENLKASFACFEGQTIDETTNEVFPRVLDNWPKEGDYQPGEALELVTNGSHPNITACVFRRALKGDMYFSDDVYSISDIPILIKLVSKYSFCISKQTAVYFVRHDAAIGRTLDLSSWAALDEHILNDDNQNRIAKKYVAKNLTKKIHGLLIQHYIHYKHIGSSERDEVMTLIKKRHDSLKILLSIKLTQFDVKLTILSNKIRGYIK